MILKVSKKDGERKPYYLQESRLEYIWLKQKQ